MDSTPRCVLFDLDGTLIDTASDLGGAANEVRRAFGMDPLPLADYRPVASAGAQGMLRVALGVRPTDPGYDERKALFLKFYAAGLSRTSAPFPGIPHVLDYLESHGIRWGIVTNKPGWLTGPLVAALGLTSRAACVVSGDTTPNPKPAPDPLLHACQSLALAPRECLYVGDDERDIVSGRTAGMPTVAAAWGYLGHGADPALWQADVIVQSPEDLLELLRRRNAA